MLKNRMSLAAAALSEQHVHVSSIVYTMRTFLQPRKSASVCNDAVFVQQSSVVMHCDDQVLPIFASIGRHCSHMSSLCSIAIKPVMSNLHYVSCRKKLGGGGMVDCSKVLDSAPQNKMDSPEPGAAEVDMQRIVEQLDALIAPEGIYTSSPQQLQRLRGCSVLSSSNFCIVLMHASISRGSIF